MERKEALEVIKNHSSFPILREALEALIPELENEDEKIRKTLIKLFTEVGAVQYCGVTSKQIIAWLEKQDEQKSAEWSEADKGFVDLLIAVFTNEHPNGLFTTGDITVFNGKSVSSNRIITWLKSLKHQNTWKPTEEQLSSLKQAISYFGGELPKELQSLYNDLQKLLD